jgi:hypothetical protein
MSRLGRRGRHAKDKTTPGGAADGEFAIQANSCAGPLFARFFTSMLNGNGDPCNFTAGYQEFGNYPT